MKDKKIYLGVGLAFLLLMTISLSYAYFSTNVSGNDNAKDVVVNAGTLSLVYTDGPEIKVENIRPGKTITKEVSVKNTGTLDTAYNIVWQELSNEITNNEMLVSATCVRLNASGVVEGTCNAIAESAISSNTIQKNISIESGITHKYTFTITFKEIDADQNYNQGKKFSGVLGIEEYKNTSPAPIYCTYDGEMTEGAEYVNGPYTYKYKQHMEYSEPMDQIYAEWTTLNADGWGVAMTKDATLENITEAPCTYINNKPIVSMSGMFIFTNNENVKSIDLTGFNTSNVINMDAMFASYNITELIGLETLDTSNVTSMKSMFYKNKSSKLDLSNFDTSKVTSMRRMFGEVGATEIIGLENLDTSSVTDMSQMFYAIETKTLKLNNFNTSKVTTMYRMFYISDADLIDVSNFNTSKVITMEEMFVVDGTKENPLEIVGLDSFDTSSVTTMYYMFSGYNGTTLDLSSFDTSNVTNMGYMLYNMANIKTIYASDKFDTSKATYSDGMFYKSTNLVGGAGTKFDSTKTDKSYARIDGGTSSPGYFTAKNN